MLSPAPTKAALAVFAATVACVLALALVRPIHNWDLIGYVASVLSLRGVEGEELSRLTYAAVQAYVPPNAFQEMIAPDTFKGFRAMVYADPAALAQQIPFYTIRPAYLAAALSLESLGLPLPHAIQTVSAIFGAAILFPAAMLLRMRGLSIAWVAVVPLFTQIIAVARVSSPDAMATFFALSGLYLALRGSPMLWLVVVLLPFVRTDFAIASVLLASTQARSQPAVASIFAALAITAYFAINTWAGNYGWAVIFNYTLFEYVPRPAELIPRTDIEPYLRAYMNGTLWVSRHPDFIIYLFAAYAVFINRRIEAIWLVPMLFVASRMALFPAYLDRSFVFATVALVIYLLGAIRAPQRK